MSGNPKRLTAAVLSALTVTALLAGCGGEKAAVGTEDLDFGGETITFTYPPGYDMVYTEDTDDPYLIYQRQRMDELEQRFNCKIEQVEGKGQYWTGMATSIAAGSPMGHVMVTQENYILDWFKAGAIANLADAMAETGIDFTDSRYSQVVRKMTRFDGGQYAFCDVPLNPTGALWYANLSLFEREQLGDIYELIENKEWTWDKCEEIATKATKTDASGTTTQWGLVGSQGHAFFRALANSNGGSVAGYDDEGNPALLLTDPASGEALEKMYDWAVIKKIANVNDGSLNWDQPLHEFTKGSIAILCGANKLLQIAQESAMEDQIGVIYPPIGPQMNDYATSASCGQMYFIPATYQDMTTKLLLLVNELYAPYENMTHADMIMAKYSKRIDNEKSMQVYIDISENADRYMLDAVTLAGLDWNSPSITSMCGEVLRGEQTPGDAIEKNKSQFLARLQDEMAGHTLKMNEP